MAPLVTPSPHRFMIKKSRNPSSSQVGPPLQGGAQFNATPRFSFVQPQSSNVSNTLDPLWVPSVSHYATLGAQGPKLQEAIEDAPDEAKSSKFDNYESIVTSGHTGDTGNAYGDEEEGDYEFIELKNPKRRRLSSSPIVDSQPHTIRTKHHGNEDSDFEDGDGPEDLIPSSNPIMSSPLAVPLQPAGSTTAPRFILPSTPGPASPFTSMVGHTSTFAKPPRFRATDEQEQRPAEPLPEMFSPHRRGQKFLAGGLAAEVISWVMNLENSVPEQHAPAGSGDRQWAVQLVVDEVRGGNHAGMTLVRGRKIHQGIRAQEEREIVSNLGPVKVILARQESGMGPEAGKLQVGNKVGIRGPTWEVMIEGERWGVGVDWKVL